MTWIPSFFVKASFFWQVFFIPWPWVSDLCDICQHLVPLGFQEWEVLRYTKQLHFMSLLVTVVKNSNYSREIRTSCESRIDTKWWEKPVSSRDRSEKIIVF